MKNRRQNAILELIREHTIDTQEMLQEMLASRGFSVTQATVSRDIRELNLVKSVGDDGVYKYRADRVREQEVVSDTFIPILRHAARSAEAANNLVVLKTHTGMGNAAGAAVDAMAIPGCVGTLAGDDTLLIIAKTVSDAENICAYLNSLIEKEAD